jgi:hypothetical protein
MRNRRIVLVTASALLISLGGTGYAAPAPNSPPPTTSGGNTSSGAAPVARQPQQERPFLCFGDKACEAEMARQKRPVDPMPLRPGSQQRDSNDGPFINGIPGQTDVPGFSDTPTPVVPD